jgi:penicillin-binding protein A
VVALDPKTGAILALASAPTFDPATIDERWQSLLNDPAGPLVNRALQSAYTPGSTFKVVTASAALDMGLVNPTEKFRCVDPLQIDGLTVDCRNHAHLPMVDFREAFAWSCNRTFALTGLELGTSKLALGDGLRPPFPWQNDVPKSAERLGEYANRFWIGRSVPFELPVEAGQLKGSTEWYPSLLAQTGIGQGELTVTPLQMALVAATIANGGVVPAPYVTSEIRSPGGASNLVNRPGGTLGQAVSARTAGTMNEMMVLSVDTAYAKPAAIQGVKVGGKTGTAEAGASGSTPHSWFIGYAPADDPKIAVAVIMEHKGSGTDFATPAAQTVLKRGLEVYNR